MRKSLKSLISILISMIMLLAVTGCSTTSGAAELTNQSSSIMSNSSTVSSPSSAAESTDKSSDTESEEEPAESKNPDLPESYMVTGENYFDYQPGLECSAFSSAYILRHYGEEADGLTLYETFPGRLSGGGAMPYGIKQFFKERGYEAEFKSDGTVEILKELLVKGAPVIVFIHVEEPYETTHNTHYIPLIGYDSEYLYFAESLTDYANCKDEKDVPYNRKTEIAKFERLWKNIDGTWDYPYFVITKN